MNKILKFIFQAVIFTLAVFSVFIFVLKFKGHGFETLNNTTVIWYLIITSFIFFLLFIAPIQAIKSKKDSIISKFYLSIVLIIGMIYLFIIVLNVAINYQNEFILHIGYSAFSVVAFDISLSLYWFNKNTNEKKLVTRIKMFAFFIFSLISLVFFFKYFIIILKELYNSLNGQFQFKSLYDKEVWSNLITLYPTALTIFYISHKIETKDICYIKWPFAK